MTKDTRAAVAGVLVAIGITSAMDATGYSQFSALPLAPLLAIFAYLQRQPRWALGFVCGRRSDYGLTILYPIVVLGVLTLIARLSNVIDVSHTNWKKAFINLVLVSISNTLVVIITEEMKLNPTSLAPNRRFTSGTVPCLIPSLPKVVCIRVLGEKRSLADAKQTRTQPHAQESPTRRPLRTGIRTLADAARRRRHMHFGDGNTGDRGSFCARTKVLACPAPRGFS